MNLKTKKSNLTKSLYIILILCIISIVCLTVYAFFFQNKQNNALSNNLPDSAKNSGEAVIGSKEKTESDQLLKIFGTDAPNAADSPEPATEPPSQPMTTGTAASDDDSMPRAKADESGAEQSLPTVKEAQANEAFPNADAVSTVQVPESITGDDHDAVVEVLAVPSFFQKPVNGSLSRPYNADMPEYSVMMNDYRTHLGIDIESDIGANVKAVADGVISEIYDDPLMGKTVVISHSGGIESIYMNLQQLIPQNITVGVEVKAGDVIGGVGESSLIELSDVPHLHLEMKRDGEFIDPLEYVQY